MLGHGMAIPKPFQSWNTKMELLSAVHAVCCARCLSIDTMTSPSNKSASRVRFSCWLIAAQDFTVPPHLWFTWDKMHMNACQSQSGVPQITLSCYKALSQQKYKVWSHFPLKPHYNTSRHLMIWFKSVRHTKILHRGSLKAEKIRNFSVMRLHLEKAPQTTQFYNIYSINNALLSTYKIPSIFLGFSCFLFHDEIFFCVKSTAQKLIYVYRYIFS